jgi:hypothetical protein
MNEKTPLLKRVNNKTEGPMTHWIRQEKSKKQTTKNMRHKNATSMSNNSPMDERHDIATFLSLSRGK